MAVRFDIRQSVNRSVLDQLTNLPNKQGTELLASINEELRIPLRLSPSSTPDRILSIGNITSTNPETGRKRTIPVISGSIPVFPSGTVTFPPVAGGTIGLSPGTGVSLTMTANAYLKVGINISVPSGNILLSFGTEGASESAATVPPTLAGTYAVGYVVVQTVATAVQNITYANIYQYDSGIIGSTSTPFTEFTKFVGFGTGSYVDLTAALADAVIGDSILVKGTHTVTAGDTVAVNNIKITFMPNASITKTTTGPILTVTASDVSIIGAIFKLQGTGTTTNGILVSGDDCFCENLKIIINDAGLTVTEAITLDATSERCYLKGSVKVLAGTVTNTLVDNGTDNDATVRG
jgi:hypothetical protein